MIPLQQGPEGSRTKNHCVCDSCPVVFLFSTFLLTLLSPPHPRAQQQKRHVFTVAPCILCVSPLSFLPAPWTSCPAHNVEFNKQLHEAAWWEVTFSSAGFHHRARKECSRLFHLTRGALSCAVAHRNRRLTTPSRHRSGHEVARRKSASASHHT